MNNRAISRMAGVCLAVTALPISAAVTAPQLEQLLTAPTTGAEKVSTTTAPHYATRAFNTDLNADGVFDSVYYDRNGNDLKICYSGSPVNCASQHIHARDVIPANSQGGRGLLFLDDSGDATFCRGYGNGAVPDCHAAGPGEFATRLVLVTSEMMLAEYGYEFGAIQCTLLDGRVQHCSSSRPFETGIHSIIGPFSTPGKAQLLTLSSSPSLCDVDRNTCAPIVGLPTFESTTKFAGAKLTDDERFSLLAVNGSKVTVCDVRDTAIQATAVCVGEEVGPALATLVPWVAARGKNGKSLERAMFVESPSREKRASAEANGTNSSAYAAMHANNAVPTLRRYLDLQLVEKGGLQEKIIGYDDGGGTVFVTGPSYDDFSGQDLMYNPVNMEMWSDAYGFLWLDFATSSRSVRSCTQCDNDYAAFQAYCDMARSAAFGFGLGATVIVTGLTTSSGPGAVGTFATGIAFTTAFSTMVDYGCRSEASSRYASCRSASC